MERVVLQDRKDLADRFEAAARRFTDLARDAALSGTSALLERYLKALAETQRDVAYSMLLIEISSVRRDELGFVVSETERYEHDHESRKPDTEPILEALETLRSRVEAL